MAKPRVSAGGGLPATWYAVKKGKEAGFLPLYRRLRSRNACKTCGLGMGGQRGGMVNESGHFPEVCKKSIQAQAADMGRTVSEDDLRRLPFRVLEHMSPRELDRLGRVTFPMCAGPGDDGYRRI